MLVVDADRATAARVRAALPPESYEVVEAADSASALGTLRQGTVDAVVSELLLPDGDGLHLLVEARLRYPLQPRLVLSALEDFKVAIDAINEAEVFRFLRKPSDPATLRAAIEEAFGRADALREAKGVQEQAERRRLALIDLETDFPGFSRFALGPDGYFIPPRRLKGLVDRLRGTPLGEALAASVAGSGPASPGNAPGQTTVDPAHTA